MNLYGSLSRLVSIVFRKNSQNLTVRPNQTTTYTAARDIQLPTDDTDHVLISKTSTDVLTNKSYDAAGTGNVLTNVANGNISASAAIAFSKLAALPSADILVGNGSNVATAVAVSGEATLANTGAVTLSNAAVIAKVLTGYTSGAGTITAADSILTAIEKLNGNQGLYLKLDGSNSPMTGNVDWGGFKILNIAEIQGGTSSGYLDLSASSSATPKAIRIADKSGLFIDGNPGNSNQPGYDAAYAAQSNISGLLSVAMDDTNGGTGFVPITFTYTGAAGSGPHIDFMSSKGTYAAPTALAAGNGLGQLIFRAKNASGYGFGVSAFMAVSADEAQTNSALGSRFGFFTATNGSTSMLERLRIDGANNLRLMTTGAVLRPEADGGASLGTVSLRFDTGWFKTSLQSPLVLGDSAASGNLTLRSTSDSTKGFVQVDDGSGFLVSPNDPDALALLQGQNPSIGMIGNSARDTDTELFIAYVDADGGGPEIDWSSSRGTYAAPDYLLTGDKLSTMYFTTWNGSDITRTAAKMQVLAAEDFTGGTQYGSSFSFQTVTLGTTSMAERLKISSAGILASTNVLPNGTLDLGSSSSPWDLTYSNAVVFPSNGQFTGIQGNAAATASINYRLPPADGSAGFVLSTDAAGNLSWVSNASSASFKANWVTADGTTKAITHSLGTLDVIVQVYDSSTGATIDVDSTVRTSTSVVTLTASEAPAVSWRVLILAT